MYVVIYEFHFILLAILEPWVECCSQDFWRFCSSVKFLQKLMSASTVLVVM